MGKIGVTKTVTFPLPSRYLLTLLITFVQFAQNPLEAFNVAEK